MFYLYFIPKFHCQYYYLSQWAQFFYLHFIISTVVYIYDQSNLCLKHNPIVKHQSPDSYLLCFSSSFVGVSCEALSSLCIMIHHFYIFWNHSPLKILDWYMVAHNSYVLNTHLFLSCCLFFRTHDLRHSRRAC
jgi:hypothetical protein